MSTTLCIIWKQSYASTNLQNVQQRKSNLFLHLALLKESNALFIQHHCEMKCFK